ncbi:MAG: replication-associated recombination protein A [Rickettsiales bacterium]|jgi:putative ATPase|nr:replication-associated recombination protein A [Rickettsiales bacterium]
MFQTNRTQPLADKIRPTDFNFMVGQEHLFDENGIISRIINGNKIPSCILWGPAGCGKTTTAKILAKKSGLEIDFLSATSSGSADLRNIFEKAEKYNKDGKGLVLVIDEIHCFRRNQQDLFLPFVENGFITLIGTTTENPSFEINSALLSRCRLIVFKPLSDNDLKKLMVRAEEINGKLPIEEECYQTLCELSGADGRYLLNLCEELFNAKLKKILNNGELLKFLQHKGVVYDKAGEGHYNLISALHKSVRGSDAQGALYWCARMMMAGEKPHFLLRRLIRMAMEDIGMSDPQALVQAINALQAYDFLGSPEGDIAITNLVIYLANCPKSNSGAIAYADVMQAVKGHNYMPPKHILNAPTKMMKDLGYNENYQYDHDTPNCFSGQNYFPTEYSRRNFYIPNERGFEREIKKRIEYWDELRKKLNEK